MPSKKKTFKQEQIKFLFHIKWKFIKGEVPERYPKEGVTIVESTDADIAKTEWIAGNCIWGRRYKVISVTETKPTTTPTNEKARKAKSEPEHSNFDDIPDF